MGTCDGAEVVGVCLPANDAVVVDAIELSGTRIPVVGTDRTVIESARETGAGIVVLTATDSLGPDDIRELMWQLAAEGIELVVTAGLPEVAAARMVAAQPGGGALSLSLELGALFGFVLAFIAK